MDILIFILCVYFILKIITIIEGFRKGKAFYNDIEDLTVYAKMKDSGKIDISKKKNKLKVKLIDKDGNVLLDTGNE